MESFRKNLRDIIVTDGYFYGIVSAIIMIVVAIITCALTTQIKKQESIKAESEKERMRANLLIKSFS